jgi:hypothetical protein
VSRSLFHEAPAKDGRNETCESYAVIEAAALYLLCRSLGLGASGGADWGWEFPFGGRAGFIAAVQVLFLRWCVSAGSSTALLVLCNQIPLEVLPL